MPKKKKTPSRTTKITKRTKKQHPKHFLKVYWPYIPVLLLVVLAMVFGNVIPQTRVDTSQTLSYSTEMSAGNLLASTNQERTSRGLSALTLNSKLNSSAYAKAIDMVSKDYWAHNTPSGQEPWIFFDAAGYNYQKAGENLAYGYSSSSSTVVGWMNSPSHRDNMLDPEFTEVGFGFKNSPDFVGTGQETVVVAHYGNTLGAVTPAPPAPEPATLPASEEIITAEPVVIAQAPTPAPEPELEPAPEPEPEPIDPSRVNQPVNSDNPVADDIESTSTTKLQELTNGKAPWSAIVLSVGTLALVVVWLIKHAILVKRYVMYGEHFVAHHPVLDLVVVVIVGIAVYLSQSSGVVL